MEFELPSDAADALENMNESELFGKVLHCNLAKPTQVSRNKPGMSLFSCSSSPVPPPFLPSLPPLPSLLPFIRTTLMAVVSIPLFFFLFFLHVLDRGFKSDELPSFFFLFPPSPFSPVPSLSPPLHSLFLFDIILTEWCSLGGAGIL